MKRETSKSNHFGVGRDYNVAGVAQSPSAPHTPLKICKSPAMAVEYHSNAVASDPTFGRVMILAVAPPTIN